MQHISVMGMVCALGIAVSPGVAGADADFIRALNLNGRALVIDGREWEAETESGTDGFTAKGKRFSDQGVLLRPPTDAARTEMIRSSVWGGTVTLEFSGLKPGPYQVVLYVWEDNHTEQFDLLVNDKVVEAGFYSGSRGMWKRLGPWRTEVIESDGRLTVTARGPGHGAANLSGIELWSGSGAVPEPEPPAFNTDPSADQIAFFENRIRPVLIESCYECHSAEAEKIKGGLVLDSRAGVHAGGDTGPAIMPGVPEASLLIQALNHLSEDMAMPPKRKLPAHVIADFEEWVRMGAPDPRDTNTLAAVKAREAIDWEQARQWWSFRPLATPDVPAVADSSWPVNDIDRFVLAQQESAGLSPAPDADRRAWIRRATYDLTGLPPTPEEVRSFLEDDSPEARATVVDRLLESPRYGERWGRHWLDVVRYADTAGDNSDYPVPQMRFYRDWVIDAFNRDMPYDEFVRSQLAGDLLQSESTDQRKQQVVATGYLANSRRFGSRVDDYPWHLTIEDTIDNVGRSFLGLTLSCARCHDHKFDPITQKDYYALYGIFHSTRYPWPGIELDKKQRDFVPLVPPGKLDDARTTLSDIGKRKRELERDISDLKKELAGSEGDKKHNIQQQLQQVEEELEKLISTPLPFTMAYAVSEGSRIEDVPVQHKGDPAKPGDVVRRRFLTVFGGDPLPVSAESSGRRHLAEWILAEQTPLTARVMANRIWQHHFGQGIVTTPNDFGKQGKPPTHPELLDYLAVRFRDGGWSVKAMHRLIMLSRTYGQATGRSEQSVTADPANRLLSGFPRRRLDAESIRDTMLFLGGNLDLGPAPDHPFPPQDKWNFTQHNPFKAVYPSNHRSVYLMTQRIQRHPFLAIFDGADPSTSTPSRTTSTTPLQALWLLNDGFVHEQAFRTARRLLDMDLNETDTLHAASEMFFARRITSPEIRMASHFLSDAREQLAGSGIAREEIEQQAWAAYIRVLFRLNEFVYLD